MSDKDEKFGAKYGEELDFNKPIWPPSTPGDRPMKWTWGRMLEKTKLVWKRIWITKK